MGWSLCIPRSFVRAPCQCQLSVGMAQDLSEGCFSFLSSSSKSSILDCIIFANDLSPLHTIHLHGTSDDTTAFGGLYFSRLCSRPRHCTFLDIPACKYPTLPSVLRIHRVSRLVLSVIHARIIGRYPSMFPTSSISFLYRPAGPLYVPTLLKGGGSISGTVSAGLFGTWIFRRLA